MYMIFKKKGFITNYDLAFIIISQTSFFVVVGVSESMLSVMLQRTGN